MPDDSANLAGIGHNEPPLWDEEKRSGFLAKLGEITEKARLWAKKKTLETLEDAEQLNDFVQGVGKFKKEVDTYRADLKKPFDDKAKEIQAAFKPDIIDPLDTIHKHLDQMVKDYHRRAEEAERARLAEEKRRAEEERRKAEEAARKAAEDDDFAAAAAAERAAKEAEEAIKAAEKGPQVKIGSASGGGRTYARRKETIVTVTNAILLAGYYVKQGDERLLKELQRIAEADVRATAVDHSKIPGISVEVR